jgi:glycosyltransferase involved in cell wall biosynthesis
MVFVPTDEGFGYPLLEAMAARTPVIASSIPVLREISDGHALWIEANDAAELTKVLGALRTSDPHVQELVAHARIRATQFNLENMATRTLASYERAVHSVA